MKRLTLCVLLYGALISAAAAQEPVPSLIRADLLIFHHTAATTEQVTYILNVPPRPGDTLQASVRLFHPTEAPDETDNNSDIRLVADDNKLNEGIEKLEQSGNFEVLHQVAWQQPVYDSANTPRVSLVSSRHGKLLKGTAQLSFERYFQLAITLLYEPRFSDAEPLEQESPESETVFIHLKEVMTDNILYYLDHPLVGVLAQITVLETIAPEDN